MIAERLSAFLHFAFPTIFHYATLTIVEFSHYAGLHEQHKIKRTKLGTILN